MDRIDKVLLVLPFLPVADLISTLSSLSRGGQEIGILARPILENYGPVGLVMLAASASSMFLVSMAAVIYIKRLLTTEEWKFRWVWHVLAFPMYWFFMLEGVYVSTVVMNFLVPVSPLLTQIIVLRALIIGVYFVLASTLTMSQMKQLPRF